VTSDAAELSSISSALADLAVRITGIAERRDEDPDDAVAPDLFEVDRSLRTAMRKLDRARDRLG
jgi:hypothetical protein